MDSPWCLLMVEDHAVQCIEHIMAEIGPRAGWFHRPPHSITRLTSKNCQEESLAALSHTRPPFPPLDRADHRPPPNPNAAASKIRLMCGGAKPLTPTQREQCWIREPWPSRLSLLLEAQKLLPPARGFQKPSTCGPSTAFHSTSPH